jgi:DNA-binding beta-propeller fold protein YncE
MRIARIGYAMGIAAAVAIAGCSSNGSSLGPIAQGPTDSQSVVRKHVPVIVPGKLLTIQQAPRLMTKSWAIPAATAKLVYTCTFGSSFCEWFKVNRNVVQGQITGLTNPQGIGVDPHNGDVYVANTGGSDVPVFAKGSTTMIKDLSDAGQFPVDVAIDKNGTAYVANIFDTSFGNGSVSVYPPNATSPSRTITDQDFIQVISVAVDEHHLLVVCYNGTFGGQCDEFPNGHGHGVSKITGMFFAGGVAFDNNENLVVSDQQTAFDVFNGTTFALCGSTPQGKSDEVMVAINRDNSSVVGANFTNGTLDQFAYDSCTGGVGAPTHTYHVGTSSDMVTGVAYDPATRP